MLILPDYRNEAVLAEIEAAWRLGRPQWSWPRRHPYQAEYSWAWDRLAEGMGRIGPDVRVVDAGGGWGAFQNVLAATGAAVWNVDIEPAALAHALARVTHRKADLEDTGLLAGAYDGVVAVSSIEHNAWEKVLRVVRHLVGLLRPGGVFVATVPAARERVWYPAGGWPKPYSSYPQAYLFDGEAVAEVGRAVRELAAMECPVVTQPGAYRAEWDATMADVQANSPFAALRPYLSMGFVLRRLP